MNTKHKISASSKSAFLGEYYQASMNIECHDIKQKMVNYRLRMLPGVRRADIYAVVDEVLNEQVRVLKNIIHDSWQSEPDLPPD